VCFFEEPLRAFKEAHRVLKNDGYLVLGLVLSDSPWANFYKEKARGDILEPVKNQEIREGFWREGGFFCVGAKKIN